MFENRVPLSAAFLIPFALRGVGEGGSVPEIVSGLRQVAALRKVLSVSLCTSVRDLDAVPRSKAKANG